MASLTTEAAAASSSSSSSSLTLSSTDHQKHYTYEVFLSFRGEDTRSSFTDHLCKALWDRGIKTFIDDNDLRRGEEISPALLKAIEESRVAVIVLSHNYASSRWCLDELVKILECRKSKGQEVIPVFYKVDPSHVRHQKGTFAGALNKLEGRYKDRVGKWREALSDAANLSGWTCEKDQSEAEFIDKIVGDLSARLVNTHDLDVAEHPIGLESCVQDVNSLLKVEENIVRMVGIWGAGGIGKSTVAKAVFNSIHHKFESCCFLTDVRSKSLAQLQETLLSDIFKSSLKVSSVDQGVTIIKTRMQYKKVLLILDNVSDFSQLQKLVPSPNCFGPGSRILITARDERWLVAHKVDEVYEVKMLNDCLALELFSLHAFGRNGPPSDYLELARRAVRYAGGLPLALTVLGSHLFRRSREEWEATLDGCKGEDPYREIRDILKISYDALGADLKGYFLDIACFFKGNDVDRVKPILEACYNHKSVIGIKQLQEKALIRIDDENNYYGGRIWMHDLIEEMGKDIVHQESPDEPGERSRVWSEEDVDHILRNNTGTNNVIGIQVPWQLSTISLNANSFSKMKNLRYISMRGMMKYESFSGDIDYLSNQLRWLDWPECPLQCFPFDFHATKLVNLNISGSRRITRLWEGRKKFSRLTCMNLSGCTSLKELPDFSGFPNLRLLSLKGSDIRELDESIENLIGLEELVLTDCKNLTNLPCSNYGLHNPETLDASGCSKLARFPTNTKILNVDGCSLKLPKLRVFSIAGCSLLSDCDFLMTLDCWETLECLNLSRTNFVSLPACLTKFVNLRKLHLRDCNRLRRIPELPPNVIHLEITRFSTLTNRGAVIEAASPSIEEPTPSAWLSLSSETPKRHRTTEEPSPTPVNPPKQQRTAAGGQASQWRVLVALVAFVAFVCK